MSSTNGGVQETTKDPQWVVAAVRRIQAADEKEESFRLLFDHFQPQAERFLRRRGIDPQTAEDLAQDAMLRVYKGIGRFRWESPFTSWILTLVGNVYRNHRRHLATARPRAERDSVDALLESHLEGELAELPAALTAGGDDPQDAALHAESKRRLADALAELPPRMRQTFLLRYHGRSYREIARLLDVRSDTVKKHLAEARRRLRPIFDAVATLLAVVVGALAGAVRLLGPGGG